MTREELETHGYEFKISGTKYEVRYLAKWRIEIGDDRDHIRHVAKDTLSRWMSHQLDAITYTTLTGSRTIDWTNTGIFEPAGRLIISGRIEQTYRNKSRQMAYPRHVSLKQIEELCIKAATRDFVEQRLLK